MKKNAQGKTQKREKKNQHHGLNPNVKLPKNCTMKVTQITNPAIDMQQQPKKKKKKKLQAKCFIAIIQLQIGNVDGEPVHKIVVRE